MSTEKGSVGGSIGVLIAVGVCLYREGLARLLPEQTGIVVKGVAEDQTDALAKAQILRPDVVLLDTGLPDSLATVRAFLELTPVTRVIVLAVTEAEGEIIAYAAAGVSGYVTRDGSSEDLIATIRSVASGDLACSPRVAALLLRHVARTAVGVGPRTGRLTSRELQIAGLIRQGLSNKEIASRLSIEVSTVKNHVHHLLKKLGSTARTVPRRLAVFS